MFKITFFFVLFTVNAFSSAKVCIENGELRVYSNLIFYGGKASEAGKKCAQEIYDMFNAPEVFVNIGNKKLKVRFEISYQIETEEDVFSSIHINRRIENNYIRIEDKASNMESGISNHSLNGNCGFFAYKDKLGTSTTCAHEYAHGLGLKHYSEYYSDYGMDNDLRGTGRPGIMAQRGSLVDREYQYKENARAGTKGGTVNPIFRVVRKEDIENIKLDSLNYNRNGCAKLGKNLGMAYKSNGDYTVGPNWFIWDVLNYLNNKKNHHAPSYCK